MKYVRRKPVRDLVRDDFLKLQMAEDDKLLTISFDEEVDGLGSLPYIEEVKQHYIRVSFVYIIILTQYISYRDVNPHTFHQQNT